MELFDVYPRFDVQIKRAQGSFLFNTMDEPYLDLYGGHGVISIGHSHAVFLEKLKGQMDQMVFYSNAIPIPLQTQLAHKLAELSGYSDHRLFLCNSGAEANENALKLASLATGKRKVIAFRNSFHGRTAAALNVTDNPALGSPIHSPGFPVQFIDLNSENQVVEALKGDDVAAIIVEGIQGVGGLDAPEVPFLQFLKKQCEQSGALLILDEIQSGFGRTGKFFAHQHADIQADLVTMAKGMGNGFPVAGVLIAPHIKAHWGQLGTTFGGNHLACTAALAVLEALDAENLMQNAREVGALLQAELSAIPTIKRIKGKGLMLGIECDFAIDSLRKNLLDKHRIFTGAASNPNLLRILPPLNISTDEIQPFLSALKLELA